LEEKEDPRMVDRPYQYKHIIATFFDCDANLLDKNHFLKTSLLAIEKANMTLVHVPNNPLVYKVDEDIMGGGVSVNALIPPATSQFTPRKTTLQLNSTVQLVDQRVDLKKLSKSSKKL
jgi:hypothetical protein